jgi:hypothetical protein
MQMKLLLRLAAFAVGLGIALPAFAEPRECHYDGRGLWVCSTPRPEWREPEWRERRAWHRWHEHHDWTPMPLHEEHRWEHGYR